MSMFGRFIQLLRKRKGLIIVITAALLLELLSAGQYYFTRQIVEDELEKRAETELTLKAVLTKSTLNSTEDILKNFIWKIQANLDVPDSAYTTMRRMSGITSHLKGCGVAFEPNYYPSKGRLFEVYAKCMFDGRVAVRQIANDNHDYTKLEGYQKAKTASGGLWTDPYYDAVGAEDTITTFFMPIHDRHDNVVGVAGIDVSLDWLTDTIESRHSYPSSFTLLLTEDGAPVILPSRSRISNKSVQYIVDLINDSTVNRHKSRSERSKFIKFDTNERDGTVFYAKMKGEPSWQVAVVCYDDEVFAALSELRIIMLLLSLLAFSILLFIIFSFARSEKKLNKQIMKQERIDRELRIASDIQQDLLPTDAELSPLTSEDISVEGRLIPAKAVGGDLYNAFVQNDKLFFCIGDVSGKGVAQALIMAITQTLFHNIASRESNPAEIMNQLNVAACRNNKTNIFVTMFIGVLDLPTGHLRYCNAGHEVPLLLNAQPANADDGAAGNCAFLDVKPNIPIGLFDDFKYGMQQMVMQSGSTLFLYTDGLTEARNVRNDMFGRECVLQMFGSESALTSKEIIKTVISKVNDFSENAEQSDDLALLAIKYTHVEEQYILDEQLTLHNDVKEVARLGAFVKDIMARLNIGNPLALKTRLALEEAVVNVIEYAYPPDAVGEINIRVTLGQGTRNEARGANLKFVITDSGVPFNPTKAATADTTLSVEDRPVGGLGILLVRELMDSVNYEHIDGKNVLTLKKRIEIEENIKSKIVKS